MTMTVNDDDHLRHTQKAVQNFPCVHILKNSNTFCFFNLNSDMDKLQENISSLIARRPNQFKIGLGAAVTAVPIIILLLKPHLREFAIIMIKIFGSIPATIFSHSTREKSLKKRDFKQSLTVGVMRAMFSSPSIYAQRYILPQISNVVASEKNYSSKLFKGRWLRTITHKHWKGYWIGDGIANLDVDDPSTFNSIDIVFMYLHGGGFTSGSPTAAMGVFVEWIKELQNRNIRAVVFSVEYFLAPEHKFPAARDQIIDVYRDHLLTKLHISANNIVLAGDDAGGNLALSSAIKLRDHHSDIPLPSALLLISPWVSLLTTSASFAINAHRDFVSAATVNANVKEYLEGTTTHRKDPEVSPLYASTFANLPPMAVVVGHHEVFRDDLHAFVQKAHSEKARCEKIENDIGVHDWLIGDALAGKGRWKDGVTKTIDFVTSTRL